MVIASNSDDHVFYVSAEYVYISGFSVTGACYRKAGICLSNDCIIENCNVLDNEDGICLYYSSNNTIAGNTASSNNFWEILIFSSSNNTVSNNRVVGIYLHSSSNNNIVNNIIINCRNGIRFYDSSNYNKIENNTISSNNWY
ncbi:MAG: hypothetical protein DRJ43_02770 [Thermoprotei archaeon]|nr:MAG: hypothetical protein DRJ43_02770 [Thermoprotei archaeon]